ncbi:MAG: hypothetical protein E8D48_03415 [Nitrospira sp.]|nr:MAG: hypothetical protein E8D48_03415 [Nitrospira sp.]
MKQPRDFALLYLALADRDLKTCRQLCDIPDSDDEAIGFHAQQAIENVSKPYSPGKRSHSEKPTT